MKSLLLLNQSLLSTLQLLAKALVENQIYIYAYLSPLKYNLNFNNNKKQPILLSRTDNIFLTLSSQSVRRMVVVVVDKEDTERPFLRLVEGIVDSDTYHCVFFLLNDGYNKDQYIRTVDG